MRHFILSALLLAGCASAASPELPSASLVITAERAFAARAGEIGWVPAFREYVAPDGQLGQAAGFSNAPQDLAATPDDGNRDLFWWPAFAGISRSGDLGFTTGPVSVDAARTPRGHYFTMWRRQPDGAWKWIYDGGVGPITDPGTITPEAGTVPTLPLAGAGAGSAEAAVAQVAALERGAANAAGLVRYLATDAHIYRSRQPRAVGGPESAARLVFPAPEVSYTVMRTEASAAGDLALTLGEARWTADGQEVQSIFARVWQYRGEAWRIVYDQLIIPRPPPPG